MGPPSSWPAPAGVGEMVDFFNRYIRLDYDDVSGSSRCRDRALVMLAGRPSGELPVSVKRSCGRAESKVHTEQHTPTGSIPAGGGAGNPAPSCGWQIGCQFITQRKATTG
jgi:hypothetical protein